MVTFVTFDRYGVDMTPTLKKTVDLATRLSVSPLEAAQVLGVCRDTVYKLLNDGTIRSVQVGGRSGRRLIAVEELRRLLNEGQINDAG